MWTSSCSLDLNGIHTVVTDADILSEDKSSLEDKGIEMIIAE
jgi:hypothetical protein